MPKTPDIATLQARLADLENRVLTLEAFKEQCEAALARAREPLPPIPCIDATVFASMPMSALIKRDPELLERMRAASIGRRKVSAR